MKNFGFKKQIAYATAFVAIAGVFAISPLAIQDVSAASDIDATPGFAISPELGAASAIADNGNNDADDAGSSDNGSENSFTTGSNTTTSTDPDFAMSDEVGGNTDDNGGTTNPTTGDTVGGEYSFVTDGSDTIVPTDVLAISDEFSFVTDDNGGTTNPTDDEIVVSGEFSFITNDGGNPPTGDPEFAISGEFSFITDDDSDTPPTGPDFAISEEQTFRTLGDDNPGGGGGGGGCWKNCGDDDDDDPEVVEPCSPYLEQFIRLGYDNDPVEVLKLKRFLNEYEGFNLELTPIYDIEAYNAVREFQLRYADDVLDPWGITEPTGYVFVTTTLKINRIVCNDPRPTTFEIDLPGLIQEVPAAADLGDFELFNPDVSDLLGQLPFEPGNEEEGEVAGIFAALGFLNFEGLCDWYWLIILILLLILGYLVYRNKQLKKEIEDLEDDIDLFTNIPDMDDDTFTWDDHMDEDVIPSDFDEDDFEFEPTKDPEDMESLIENARDRIVLDEGKSVDEIQMLDDEVEKFEEATKSHAYGHVMGFAFLPWIADFLCKWAWLIILILLILIIYTAYKNYNLKKRREELYEILDEIDAEQGWSDDEYIEEDDFDGPTLDELIAEIRQEREGNE